MTVLLSQITSAVRLPDGSTPPDGNKIIFTLTSWDKTDDAVIMHGPVEAQIESGAIDVSLHRVGTGLRQTAYRVDYVYHNAAARRWLTLSMGQIAPDGPGPYDLADLLAVPVTTPTPPDVLAQALGAAAAAAADADSTAADRVQTGLDRTAAAASAAEAALYDGIRVDDFADLATLAPAAVAVGQYVQVRATGRTYVRVASGGDLDYAGTGGVMLDVVREGAGGALENADLLNGRATNLLIKRPLAGATRLHIEPNGVPTGTAAKLDLMHDDYEEDNANYRILNLYTKNYDAADTSTTQGNNGVSVIGVKGVGRNFGIWPSLHFGFSDDGPLSAVPMKMYYFDTSDTVWRTPMKGAWRTGVAVDAGDYMLASNKLYQAAGSGTTGATVPSHSAGSVSDGAVTWAFVRDYAAVSGSIRGNVVFGNRDDMPKFGLPTVRAQFAQDAAIWNGKKVRFLDSANATAWSMFTQGGTDDLYIESADGTARLRLDSTGKFIQLIGLAIAAPSVTATLNSATPSIAGVRELTFNNSSATTVTSFSGGIGNQEIFVRTGNGQTTLQHGANIKIVGGANRLMTTDDLLHFIMNSAGTVATEVGYRG